MTLNRKRTLAAASRRTSIAAAVLLGAATCASAMSLRLEVPADAIIRTHAPVPVQPLLSAAGQEPNGPIRIAGGVAAGQLVSRVNPVYPSVARAAGVEGAVLLHAIIGKDGTMKNLAVISGPPMLVPAAMEAVRQWVYKPYLLNGNPVEVDTTITVNFSLVGHQTAELVGHQTAELVDHQTAELVDHQTAELVRRQTANAAPQPPADPRDQAASTGFAGEAYNIGGSIRPPVLTYAANPEYSESATKAKRSGNVLVALIVDANGKPQNVHVARGLGDGLDEKAVEAVQQYRFKPATQNGEPVPVNLKVEVNFQMF